MDVRDVLREYLALLLGAILGAYLISGCTERPRSRVEKVKWCLDYNLTPTSSSLDTSFVIYGCSQQ